MNRSARVRLIGYFGSVGLLQATAWSVLILWLGPAYPGLVGLGLLAFALGLRHAFDADHIAAIDNTTRKLMQESDQTPVGVGFFFSLGHSTVVTLIAAAVGLGTRTLTRNLPLLRHVGGLLGTGISGAFLYVIGFINLAVLLDLARVFRAAAHGDADPEELERLLQARGLMNRLLGRFYRLIRRETQMYPVGFLFGLGFDTASEVTLLAISGGAAAGHLPPAAVLILPLLFAAGMTLMDTADGALMCAAYGWAFVSPLRKLYYNLTLTALSVLVALSIGTLELGQLAAAELGLRGGLWAVLSRLSFGTLGYWVVGAFTLSWALAYLVWKLKFE